MQNAERGSEQNAKPRAQVVGRSLDPVVGRCGCSGILPQVSAGGNMPQLAGSALCSGAHSYIECVRIHTPPVEPKRYISSTGHGIGAEGRARRRPGCRYWGGSQFECKTADCFHPKAVEQRKCGRVTLSRSHSSRCQAFASDTPMMPQPPEETQEVRQLGNTDVFECLGVDGYNYGMLAVVRRPIGSTARPECVRGRWYWTPNAAGQGRREATYPEPACSQGGCQ